jgi:hypothetical protein
MRALARWARLLSQIRRFLFPDHEPLNYGRGRARSVTHVASESICLIISDCVTGAHNPFSEFVYGFRSGDALRTQRRFLSPPRDARPCYYRPWHEQEEIWPNERDAE